TEIRGDLTRRVRGAQLPPGSAGTPYLAATPPTRGHARDRLPGAPDPHSHQRDPEAARTAMRAFQRVPRHLDLSDLDEGGTGAPGGTSRPAVAETRSGLPRRVRGQHLARDLREPRPARAPGDGYRQRDADAEREQLDAFATASRRGAAATPADQERTSSP
ncbi:MAG: hypothetical protein JWO79_1588, partial [Actinomycetia bacterium]|nr:hypothetical protein [Actinomycetes bacterium]